MLLNRAKWYGARLSRMSAEEIRYRAIEFARVAGLHCGEWGRRRLRRGWPPLATKSPFACASDPVLPFHDWTHFGCPVDRDALLNGTWHALGLPWAFDESPDVWRRAPDTGHVWPARSPLLIPYRDGNPFGDIRFAWEPARLQQLVALALLARDDQNARPHAIELLERELRSFWHANQPYQGIHYVSAMECALRIISVCHAVDLARKHLSRASGTWSIVVALVESHARLINARLSRFSSSGNHTIAEAVGLLYAGLLFGELHGAPDWARTAVTLLIDESRQVLADGGGIEQASWYALEVSDLLGLAVGLLRSQARLVPPPLCDAFVRSKIYLSALAAAPSALPPIGDADGGHSVCPGVTITWPSYAVPEVCSFPETGLSVIARGASRVLFDHGPLGMGPSYAHGHADALSILVTWKSVDVLIDPGTYAYFGEPEWRRYFRSTRAHNTIELSARDQARQTSLFAWSEAYRCAPAKRHDDGGVIAITSQHDGYSGLGATHQRTVMVWPDGNICVRDVLFGTAVRGRIHWHLGAPCQRSGARQVKVGPCFLTLEVPTEPRIVEGATSPIQGWRSDAFGVRAPSPVVVAELNSGACRTTFTWIGEHGWPPVEARSVAHLIGERADEPS